MKNSTIVHKRSPEIIDNEAKLPLPSQLEYGELAISYGDGVETLSFKNSNDKIVEIKTKDYYESEFKKLKTSTGLKFYCIEPVTVQINNETTTYPANSYVDLNLRNDVELTITPTSDNSIILLSAFPGAISTFYPWLEGVRVFEGILFDMNDLSMYEKWNQGHQGQYKVQFAQYKNCIFWSDNAYISDVAKRTNYTLYNSSELPLCFSLTPENTYKAFYFAYNVTTDPNWSNPLYKNSFALATWATQTFSYYGLKSIGLFDMDSSEFNITLPKDCRGLMFYSPNIENAGVFDAINVTNFGAKSGSWRDAFAYCYSLKNLYIKNLKVNINVSWSPINQQSLQFIIDSAANTSNIIIYVSPYTYYRISEATFTAAATKNITISLITTNYTESDYRLQKIQINGDGNSFLANDGTYKTINIPSLENYATQQWVNDKGYLTEHQDISHLATKTEIPTIPSKVSEFENDSNYVSLEVVEQMIADAIANLNIPNTPSVDDICTIDENNSIAIDTTQLQNGTYTLKYTDTNGDILEDYDEITTFEINN